MTDKYKPLRSNAPKGPLLHPEFKYTSADNTDIRERFARVRATLNKATVQLIKGGKS